MKCAAIAKSSGQPCKFNAKGRSIYCGHHKTRSSRKRRSRSRSRSRRRTPAIPFVLPKASVPKGKAKGKAKGVARKGRGKGKRKPKSKMFDCSICMSKGFPKSAMKLKCGHKFHRRCILRWFRSSGSRACPLCRQVHTYS